MSKQVVNKEEDAREEIFEMVIPQESTMSMVKSLSTDRHKQVECKVCLRKMRSNNLKRHMLKHRKIHTLDEGEIRDEIKRRKQSLETMKYREQLELSKELKSRSDDRHKQVECIVCLRKMQSDNIKRHMLKYHELYLLDVDEIRDEIRHRKKLQETRENRIQLVRYIA